MLKEVMGIIKEELVKAKALNILMALVTFFSITYIGLLPAYHFASWLILGCLIYVFKKVDIHDKSFKKEVLIFSLLFSFLNMVGGITFSLMDKPNMNLFHEIIKPGNILYFIGIFNFLFIVLKAIWPKLYQFTLKEGDSKIKKNKKLFVLAMILILVCWLPYFLAFFPGILSYDSIEQLRMVIEGFKSISDHHPVLHTLFIALFYNIGHGITNSVMVGASLCSLAQMILMASIYSSFLVFLHNRKVNDKILFFVFLFYAILPVHGYYSITMWKDVLFGGCILLLVMEIIKLIEKEKKEGLSFKSYIPFVLASLLCVFLRNNGIYMYLLVAIFGLFTFKRSRKKLAFSFLIVFSVFVVIKGPVFNYFDVKKSESVEYIGIPLQQIGRMAYKKVQFSKKEQELLNKLIPVDKMASEYDPEKSDGIKFSEYFHEDVLNENKKEYFKLWLQLVLKHPDIAIESYSVNTLGYWYPNAAYWSVFNYVYKNELGLKNEPVIPVLKPLLIGITSKRIPVLNLEWSIGLCFWTILVFGWTTVRKRGLKYIYPYVPIFGIWLTMMLATPVFAEFRYIYGAFTCLPLLILMPYLSLKEK